jgi:hypothetical protein
MMVKLPDGQYVNPAHVVRLSPGTSGQDHEVGWVFIQLSVGSMWVKGDIDHIARLVRPRPAEIKVGHIT